MIRIQHEDFDAGAEIRALHQPGTAAVVSFTGLVRDYASHGDVSAIELEHYPAMTAKSLQAIEIEARQRWPLLEVTVIHRIGKLVAGEQIVLVVVSAAPRQAACEACAFLMDWLKTRAPFWKKEWVNGEPHWVEAKASDQDAAAKWQP
jgi:molybdopterin synthase catalytic subunit